MRTTIDLILTACLSRLQPTPPQKLVIAVNRSSTTMYPDGQRKVAGTVDYMAGCVGLGRRGMLPVIVVVEQKQFQTQSAGTAQVLAYMGWPPTARDLSEVQELMGWECRIYAPGGGGMGGLGSWGFDGWAEVDVSLSPGQEVAGG